jgi:hypothetical protein
MADERQDYTSLVIQAEKAVASVKDPDLKRIAFERVLGDLLSQSSPPSARNKSGGKTRAKTLAPASKSGPKAYIEEMIGDGFFTEPKTISMVKNELENHGHHIATTSLSGPLQKLCQEKALRRQKSKDLGAFAYSKW